MSSNSNNTENAQKGKLFMVHEKIIENGKEISLTFEVRLIVDDSTSEIIKVLSKRETHLIPTIKIVDGRYIHGMEYGKTNLDSDVYLPYKGLGSLTR